MAQSFRYTVLALVLLLLIYANLVFAQIEKLTGSFT